MINAVYVTAVLTDQCNVPVSVNLALVTPDGVHIESIEFFPHYFGKNHRRCFCRLSHQIIAVAVCHICSLQFKSRHILSRSSDNTFLERTVLDFGHTVRNVDTCQTCAVFKRSIPDFGHAVRNVDTCQTCAAVKLNNA